jgi:predicted metal-dependent HD superfamily phosphohydrolase
MSAIPTSFTDEHRTRFLELLRRTGVGNNQAVWDDIARAYSEPQRCYHNAGHIVELLQIFDTDWFQRSALLHLPRNLRLRGELELAIWWHDAVYQTAIQDPGLSNEEASACWAYTVLMRYGASSNTALSVYALVLATSHTQTVIEPMAQLIVDLDLAILGSDEYRFPLYEAEISAEYGHVFYPDYLRGRANFLEQFLQSRDYIYQTPQFRERYESQAQDNIKGLIVELRSHLKELESYGDKSDAEP